MILESLIMTPLDSQLGRTYLETYYPSLFDETAFLKTLIALESDFLPNIDKPLDINVFVDRHGLPHEIVENAAMLIHLFAAAEEIAQSSHEPLGMLLDVGGGPTIYQHIPFSLIARNIIHADLLEENRKEVENFLNQKPGAYNWDAYFRVAFRYIKDRPLIFPCLSRLLNEQNIDSAASWQSLVRRLIAGRVVPCDVFSPGIEIEGGGGLARMLSDSGSQKGVNIATAYFLLESATHDMGIWRKGLEHISSFLLPGGFLSMMAIRHADWYRSGENRIPAVSVDEVTLSQELESAGYTISQIRFFKGSEKENVGYDGMVFLLARKHVA